MTRNETIHAKRVAKRATEVRLMQYTENMKPCVVYPMHTVFHPPITPTYDPGTLPVWHQNYDRRLDPRFV